MNETVGKATAENLSKLGKSNRAIFVKTNVADLDSLHNLLHETVCNFGGVDVFVSNAGVLRAGGLEDMTPENFEFVTKINYNAYFYCAKTVSRVMKLQNKYAEENYGEGSSREHAALEHTLSQMSDSDARVLRMKYYEGYTAKEIGEILGISHEAVKKRIQRALKKAMALMAE